MLQPTNLQVSQYYINFSKAEDIIGSIHYTQKQGVQKAIITNHYKIESIPKKNV